MRTHNLFSRLGLAMVAILLLFSSQQVFAAGTLAGTVITNKAYVTYNAGTIVRNDSSAAITMTVGYKVSINLVAPSSLTTIVDSTILSKAFYVSNSGNYTDNFQLSVGHVPSGWAAQLYKDINVDQLWDAGDSAIASGGYLSADTGSAIPLILKITIPQASDDMHDSVTVDVQSYDLGPVGVTRVGGAGLQTYVAHVIIAKPVLNFTVIPTYGAHRIPGETQTFDLTITNAGHLATNGNSTVTWKYDGIKLTGEVATLGTGRSAGGGTATWTIGSLAGGSSTVPLKLTSVIEQSSVNGTGVPYNTLITNGTTGSDVYYYDGTTHYHQNVSATTAFNVGLASGALLARSTANSSGNPGDSVDYTITVKNTGNQSDTYSLTDALNGGLDVPPVYSTTLGGAAVSQPITIGQGIDSTFYVRFAIPGTATDAQTINRNVTATATGSIAPTNGYLASLNNIITTVTAPSLAISMSDSAAAGNVGTSSNPAPGDVIYYIVRITNNGTGTATSVSSSNLTPHTTSNNNLYTPNSVEVDPTYTGTFTQVNDNGSFTGGTVGANTGGTVQVTFNSILQGVTSVYRYRVTIQ